MLSYKDWVKLNENFSIPLGLSSPKSLGLIGSNVDLEEAKKMKKKMMDEVPDDEEMADDSDEEKEDDDDMEDSDDSSEDSDDGETGDGEVVDASSEKDDPEKQTDAAFMKKCMKGKTSCSKCKKKMSKCMCKKMKKEERDWWASIENQLNGVQKYTDGVGTPEIKNWDGISVNPGDVGSSPYTRIG